MGENIAAKRWSPEQKLKLRTSRVESTMNLTSLLNQNLTAPLDFFISASAVGIYPVNLNDSLNEDSKTGLNFLAVYVKTGKRLLTAFKKLVVSSFSELELFLRNMVVP